MKNKWALVGAILRGAAIMAMWIWIVWEYHHTTGMGTLGLALIILHVIVLSVALFIGMFLRIGDFLWTLKHDVDAENQTKDPLKTSVSVAVQAVLIVGETMYLCRGIVPFFVAIWVLIVFIILKLVDKKTIRRS